MTRHSSPLGDAARSERVDELLGNRGTSENAAVRLRDLSQKGAVLDALLAGLKDRGIVPATPAIQITGAVAFFACPTPPDGWLSANGAAISRVSYRELFDAIGTTYGAGDGSTTFNIPDLRGEFIRALDEGRGIDAARALGSFQAQQFEDHNHATLHTEAVSPWGIQGATSSRYISTVASTQPRSLTSPAQNGNRGSETRPRNIALLACIRY